MAIQRGILKMTVKRYGRRGLSDFLKGVHSNQYKNNFKKILKTSEKKSDIINVEVQAIILFTLKIKR
jgi:hypothetical protein